MKRFKDISIKWKLTFVCMLTSIVGLTIASLTFYVYELNGIRDRLGEDYTALADVVAPICATPLTFLDADYAEEILAYMGQYEAILHAAIFDAEENTFATYTRPDATRRTFVPPVSDGTYYESDDFQLLRAIVVDGEKIGSLFLHVELTDARARALSYAGLVASVLFISIIAAFIFSSWLIRIISRPILELVQVTHKVTEEGNYSLRAEKTTEDELGALIVDFNNMLEQIQKRDDQLEEHRNRLEGVVAARTEEIRKLSLAAEQSPYTTIISDPDGSIEYVNNRYTEATGYVLEEARLRDPAEVLMGKESDLALQDLMEAVRREGQWRGEIQNTRKSGEPFWESVSVAPLRTSNGDITHFVWVREDVTDRRAAAEALRESEERYALAARGSNDGLWDWDLRQDTIYYSPRWVAMLGYEPEQFTDSPEEWMNRVHPDDLPGLRQSIRDHLYDEAPYFETEFRLLHRDGTYRWMLSRGVSDSAENGKPHRFAGSQTDITDRKQAQEKLFYDATHDVLTGLPNRGLFVESLYGAMHRSERSSDWKYAVLFLDLDRFKIVNDSLGHAAGDELLITVAKRISKCTRPQDVVARLGGDEFALLIEGIDGEEDASRVAERIIDELSKPLELDGHEVFTGASVGIALSTQGYASKEEVLRDADAAMYRAKSQGKGRFSVFDQQLHDAAIRRLKLENDLRRAVDNQEFILYYQPIIDLSSNEVTSFEALVRWQHPEEGLVSPAEFLPLAEKMGLIVPMGWWIMGESCHQLQDWRQALPELPFSISINISGKQFLQADFVSKVEEIFRASKLNGAALKLEVTESAIIQNSSHIAEILDQIRALDILLCIDNFGTGYSSLSHLHRFPFNVLKIDRSFVSKMDSESEILEIVETILVLSKTLGLYVTAEGVETMEQFKLLRSMGCDSIQGFLIAKPMPSKDVLGYLASFSIPGT